MSEYWTPERCKAFETLKRAILRGDEEGVLNALDTLPAAPGHWVSRQPLVARAATTAGLDPASPLPKGAKLIVEDGPATGHGRLSAGERSTIGELEVGGKIPDQLDRAWMIDNHCLLLFGGGRKINAPPCNGGGISIIFDSAVSED